MANPDDSRHDDSRTARRADLLPEEEVAGSDDPEAQAAQILAESDQRTLDRNAAPGSRVEHRGADEGVDEG